MKKVKIFNSYMHVFIFNPGIFLAQDEDVIYNDTLTKKFFQTQKRFQ